MVQMTADIFFRRNFSFQLKPSINEFVAKNKLGIIKDKRTIILYAVPISLWPMLGKENWYSYTMHSNNNDRCI